MARHDGVQARARWRAPVALLLLACALLNYGCADAFIPPPEYLPPSHYEEGPPVHLQPPDL